MSLTPFDAAFHAITGFSPMRWQRRLFDQLRAGHIPEACDIPTGLGKTSVIVLWALALAAQVAAGRAALPRRLVYVVNRRTVVDQATDDAVALLRALRAESVAPSLIPVREALRSLCVDPDDEASPLAVSTLRGELADNRAWQADPARPAIVVGTVDMIGSRMLFSAYGRVGWKMRGFHAGLIAQDALLVHDEAHLTPPFGELARTVAAEQRRAGEPRPLRVLDLSATRRGAGSLEVFALREDEKAEPIVAERIGAAKSLRTQRTDEKELSAALARAALRHREACARVLVYVRTPEIARQVHDLLVKELGSQPRVALLTGTLRGHERDELAKPGSILAALLAGATRPALEASLFLVSTSAGEVGVNLDADHLVCDLTPLDGMIQRLGRVNRLGRPARDFVARVDVLDVPNAADKRGEDAEQAFQERYSQARSATRAALGRLPEHKDGGGDGSPAALKEILDEGTVNEAFAPSPRVVPCTDILLDTWALTSVREALPGRPAVDRWLHGVESEPPETVIVWRAETAALAALLRDRQRPGADAVEAWLGAHRIEARERLREPTYRVAKALEVMAKRLAGSAPDLLAVVLPADGPPRAEDLGELLTLARNKFGPDTLAGATVLLPPEAGGLAAGMLDGGSAAASDVADASRDTARARVRVERDTSGEFCAVLLGAGTALTRTSLDEAAAAAREAVGAGGAELVEKLRMVLDQSDEGEPASWLISLGPAKRPETALDASAAAPGIQTLTHHLGWAGEIGARLGRRLGLPPEIGSAVETAARWHDRGKNRVSWQRAIGHGPPRRGGQGWEPWAKTGHGRFDEAACPGYRHELGSLLEAQRDAEIAAHPERDLVLHLIASHHGRARPSFPDDAWDPEASDAENAAAVAETARRYARLQRRFGRWGLAWLEAIMKSADAIATVRGEAVGGLPR